MEEIEKRWDSIGQDNQLLIKKGIVAGIALYVVLLVVHDLLPYALIMIGTYFLYKWIAKQV